MDSKVEPEVGVVEESYSFADCDFLVKARLERANIQMLVKLVEGLGHLGVVTTTDKINGEVLIQTTKDCWPDLAAAIKRMPFQIEILS